MAKKEKQLKQQTFAEFIREWAEWNRKGADEAKLHFETGFRM